MSVADKNARMYSDMAAEWWKEDHDKAMKCHEVHDLAKMASCIYDMICEHSQMRESSQAENRSQQGLMTPVNHAIRHYFKGSYCLLNAFADIREEYVNRGFNQKPLEEVEQNMPKVAHQLLDDRLRALGALRDGWLDGDGAALPSEHLAWILVELVETSIKAGLLPYLYPTPEGELLVEWSLGPREASLEVDLATRRGCWDSNWELEDVEEKSLDLDPLNPENDWPWITQRISSLWEADL